MGLKYWLVMSVMIVMTRLSCMRGMMNAGGENSTIWLSTCPSVILPLNSAWTVLGLKVGKYEQSTFNCQSYVKDK
jgi:hypothetical protein